MVERGVDVFFEANVNALQLISSHSYRYYRLQNKLCNLYMLGFLCSDLSIFLTFRSLSRLYIYMLNTNMRRQYINFKHELEAESIFVILEQCYLNYLFRSIDKGISNKYTNYKECKIISIYKMLSK